MITVAVHYRLASVVGGESSRGGVFMSCACGCGSDAKKRYVRGHNSKRSPGPIEPRFWGHVDQNGERPAFAPHLGRCWIWKGRCNPKGYGMFDIDSRTAKAAHRVSYEWRVGPIAPGLQLDHLCRVRHCVNPSHLEAVTNSVNVLRGLCGQLRLPQSHCKRGHAFLGENLSYDRRDGSRRCKTCIADSGRRHRARQRLA